jgi:hypothetical protein
LLSRNGAIELESLLAVEPFLARALFVAERARLRYDSGGFDHTMSYIGTVENGVVVLPPEADLTEGTKVRVEPVDGDEAVPTLEDLLAPLAGQASGLPSDLAEQHDHYLHGTPKRPRS